MDSKAESGGVLMGLRTLTRSSERMKEGQTHGQDSRMSAVLLIRNLSLSVFIRYSIRLSFVNQS